MPALPLFVFGPTASGKTSLAIHLAQALNGEIINADSRQVYREMPIITAMPTAEEFAAAPHHLFDFLRPGAPYSATLYASEAVPLVKNLLGAGKTPLVVGGTGFYLKTLAEGISPIPEVSPATVAALEDRLKKEGLPTLYRELEQKDPALARRLPAGDTQRILRGLAVHAESGKPLSDFQKLPATPPLEIPPIRMALAPPKDILYKRIHDRFEVMLAEGVLEEAATLRKKGYHLNDRALTSLGLKEIFSYLEGRLSLEEMKEKTLRSMRRYAKRQMTWLRHQYRPDILLTSASDTDKALQEISQLYEKKRK